MYIALFVCILCSLEFMCWVESDCTRLGRVSKGLSMGGLGMAWYGSGLWGSLVVWEPVEECVEIVGQLLG